MKAKDWWQERIIGALSSYWVYQHLGNLSPDELAENVLYQRVRAHPGDAEPLLREFAIAADREADGAKGARWSYRRDFGPVRLLVIDSRCGRILDGGHRSMLSEAEFDWVEAQLGGDYDAPADRHVAALAAAQGNSTTSRPGTSCSATGIAAG